ncbi:hypothetical protein AAV94_13540 [Lampropedia cohaerens]|uniref:Uncharacterized protein n=2 Tax=Lampropedia cohaerens TaxID=1610491 RepID=A0A0U1PWA2_9BURK|nr:hypothetical protein AAV94_13540 [Lampropedia cohaerens]
MWYPALYLFGVFPIAVPFLGILSGALLPWDDRNWAGMALFLTAAMLFMLVSGRRYVYRQRVKIDVAQQTITVERRSVLRRHPVQTIRYASLERLQVLYATNRRISVKLLLVYDGGQQLPLLQDAVWESEFKDRRNLLAEFLKVPLQGPE